MFDGYHLWRNTLFRLGVSRSADFQRQAEAFRRAKQFRKAATCYRLHLERHPEDFGSWLDLGFCEAFVGRPGKAAKAYHEAAAHFPRLGAAFLAVARQRAADGRQLNALAYYRRAFSADPKLDLTAEDRSRVGPDFLAGWQRDHVAAGRRIYLDITDLLRYLRHNVHGTGIQRVELSMIAAWFCKLRQQDVVFVFCRDGRSQIFRISEEDLAALVDATEDPAVNHRIYQPTLDKIYAEAPLADVRPGDVFMVLGAFWTSIDYARTFVDLRERGVLIGAYIYDLIPVTHPEFVNTSGLNGVLDRFGDVLTEVDFVCTISEFVAQEVRNILQEQLVRSIPVVAVPLAHDPPRSGNGQVDAAFLKSLPAEYVLCICTIEGRKNHLLLFDVWTQLLAKHGEATPPLIVVGKWGWRGEAFKQRLEETRSLSGKIIVLGNLTDAKIDHLYRHCLFTVFPSFVEGWGLPVGESLASSTPCIASNASSIPEVGGDLVRYIDPFDPQGAFAVIEKPLIDRADLAAWKARIVATFQPRTWSDVVDHFVTQVEYCARSARPQPATKAEPLRSEEIHRLNNEGDGSLKSWHDRAHKFVFLEGWHGLESWGIWSAAPKARLSIRTELPAGAQVDVRLLIRGAPPRPAAQVGLVDATGSTRTTASVPTDNATWVDIVAIVDDAQTLVLDLERIDADFPQPELFRPLYLGLCALAFSLKGAVGRGAPSCAADRQAIHLSSEGLSSR